MSLIWKAVRLILMVLIGAVTLISVESFNLREPNDLYETSADEFEYHDQPVESVTEIIIDASTSAVAPTEIPGSALTLEELSSLTMLDDTNATIQAMQLYMYRQKTQLTLNFLNRVIPFLKSIHKNMTHLYSTSVDPSSSYQSFAAYKEADDALENKLTQAEGQINGNRHHIQRYVVAYRNAEQKLRGIHQTLGNILLPQLNPNQNQGESEEAILTPSTVYAPLAIIRTTEPPSSSSSIPIPSGSNEMTGCGGALNSDSGSIAYKYGNGETLISGNEGCVWTISTTQHSAGISLTLRAVQFEQNNENLISVGYFRDYMDSYPNPNSLIWQKFASSTTPQTLVIPSPVAFVHFVTSPSALGASAARFNSGFHLDFQNADRLNSGGTTSSPFIYNVFLTGASGSRRYPLTGEYKNSERTVIIVQPTFANSALTINNWSTESGRDRLSIWTFGSDFQWTQRDTLSGESSGSSKVYRNQVPRNNPYILTFTTDSSVTSSGFGFIWNSST